MAERLTTWVEHRVMGWATATVKATEAAAKVAEAGEQAERAARAAETVARVAAAVAHESEQTRLIAVVLDQAVDTLGARIGYVYLADEEHRELRLAGNRNLPSDLTERLERVALGASCLAARAADTKRVQIVEAANLEPRQSVSRDVLARTGTKSLLAAPLIAFDRLLGVLVYGLAEPHRFAPEELAAIRTIAEVFAVGLAHTMAYEAERHLRRQVEAERARFQTIVDSAPDGIIYIEAATGHMLANPKACEIAGPTLASEATPARFVGLVLHPDGRPLAVAELPVSRALRGETMRTEELIFARPDGGRVSVLTSTAPVRGPDAAVIGAVIVFQDISARKRVEEALRRSEERFRLLAEHAQDIIYRYRLAPTRATEYVCPAVAAITGYTPAEFYADATLPFKLLNADARSLLEAVMRAPAAFSGQPIILQGSRKDGAPFWLELRNAPMYDGAGNLVAMEGIARDVTERKRAEEEHDRLLDQLEADRVWLRTVIERCPVGIILLQGPRGERVLANRWAERIFGRAIPSDAGLAEYGGQVLRADGTPLSLEELCPAPVLHGETITGRELVIRRPDGREVPVLLSAGPIRDTDGNILGAVVVVEDITQMKELERLREEWTSIIAHDLRQPVTVITGYAGLLAKQVDRQAPSLKPKIEHILASARQLNRMVADLLDVSRVESRRLCLERQPVDLPELVRAVVDRAADTTRGHAVQVKVEGEIPRLEADPGRLEQVLGNLLSNAAKYGYPATPIVVEVERRGREVEVSVSNRGRGIPPDDLPKLFTRFHRTRWAEEEGIPGLGLGLYITKGLVEAHGGRIWAESVPDETTTCHFTLPLAEEATGDTGQESVDDRRAA